MPWIAPPRKYVDRIGRWFDGGIPQLGAHRRLVRQSADPDPQQPHESQIEALRPWLGSPHKFQRRAVPVALLPLLDEKRELQPLFDLVEPLMLDAEKPVQQGVGWFLREAWKRCPKPTEKLLLQYKDRAPRVIYQYATEKMTSPQRERFRKKPR